MGFALKYPVRTVISDRDMPVYVGVAIGGKREVDLSDWATFELDASLIPSGKTLLPQSHYTIADPSTMRVRKSNLPVADVKIDFTEAFYADAKSLTGDYVLPFKMLDNSIGAIREGGETSVVAIKYISTYAGTYYRNGTYSENNGGEKAFGDAVDLIKSPSVTVNTVGKHTISLPLYKGNGRLILTVEGGNVTVDIEGSTAISATATYATEGDYQFVAFTGKKAPQFDLNYQYVSNGITFKVSEKLVLRQDPINDLRVELWQ